MEQQHVYHHHYHYHYTYPFPPGIPPNAPQNDEVLNQEAPNHDNDEALAEDDEEDDEEDEEEEGEEEEHSERDDTEDHHNPEDRSPSPVQEDPEFTYLERSGFVVFDDCLTCLDLDLLSLEAQARFPILQSNNDDHQEGPPRKKARTSSHPEQKKKPRENNHITIIDKARIIATDSDFRVVNCDPTGPQIDICWRIPGHRNIWLARVGHAAGGSRKKLRALIKAHAPPEMPLLNHFDATVDEENALSLIECSCGDRNYEKFEGGCGQVVPGDEIFEYLSALGKMVGFEVVRG
ncbi:hypothetical protein FPANT_12637 [Fusarium pseudoanthophilum]|uniref:Uncharacterized protein n=1 Tax=Fusarium pseudoanthophilum TaxID=48495 RepID=A0A8H5NNF6_9HYPO|nr:hypothetical protein FPANT_12637 [Fusarium pseudoanthophilum]